MQHYVKLWSNLTKSSILEQDLHVRWLWIVLLLETDADGNVYGTPEALARIANLSLKRTTEALAVLMAPDPTSTTGDEEGRRVLNPGPNQWFLVNYAKYRQMKDLTAERAKVKERVRRFRSKQKRCNADVTRGNDKYKVDVEVSRTSCSSAAAESGNKIPAGFFEFWCLYPRKAAKGAAIKAWNRIAAATRPAIMEGLRRALRSDQWTRDGGKWIPYPATWLNRGQWEDEESSEPEPAPGSLEALIAANRAKVAAQR